LVSPMDTRIRRHTRVRPGANPFDPHWRAYFEDRAFFKRFGLYRWETGIEPSHQNTGLRVNKASQRLESNEGTTFMSGS